uniref:DNA-directed RNA polymerase RpoA/D/Rpb3-type domain-containing protein n=1 Tax=viral metagenome TaxID=1070528 RepID=A0A6C0CS04_9ZZZZ
MNPTISNLSEENNMLTFRLSGVNVSFANAIRRIMLSEVPCVIMKAAPYESCTIDITTNTTRMNNELLKQRIACVPVHINDTTAPIDNYVIEVDKTNESDVIDFVTTEDFKIKDKTTDKYLSQSQVRAIFPPDPITNEYIDITRLRPRISAELEGEQLTFTATFDIGYAKQDGAYNVVSTACYQNTPDPDAISREWADVEKKLRSEGKNTEQIEFEKKDFYYLQAQKLFVSDSFDFTVETVGQFTNMDVVFRSTHVMLDKLKMFKQAVQTNPEIISQSDTTLQNGFDIKLIGEDYTLGKAIEYVLYNKYYSMDDSKPLNFCGFRKPHPHIDESLIRIAFREPNEKSNVVSMLVDSAKSLEKVFQTIADDFKPAE